MSTKNFPPKTRYAYVQNNPVNFRDLFGLSSSDTAMSSNIQNGLLLIQSTAKKTMPASSLIDTSAYSKVVFDNSKYLDKRTSNYVNSVGIEGIKTVFNEVTIYTGVDRATAQQVADTIGVPLDTKAVDGFTVGKSVFMFDSDIDLDTVKHELIHSLQAEALGGNEQFLAAYSESSASAVSMGENPYFSNEFERGAYSFGPENSSAQTNLPHGGPRYVK